MTGNGQAKVVIVYGAAGAIGAAASAELAGRGARLYLAGRTSDSLRRVADSLGTGTVDLVDVNDPEAVKAHARSVTEREGAIDAVVNAAGLQAVQGIPLADLDVEDFAAPIAAWSRMQYNTATAAGREMVRHGSGSIILLSASPAVKAIAGTGGFAAACAAIEGLTRTLAAEMGPSGVRVNCIRAQRLAGTLGDVADLPMPLDQFQEVLESMTLLRRLPTPADVARAVAYLVSDDSAATTGSIVDVTAGMSAA